MKNRWYLLLLFAFVGCKDKPVDLSGDTPVRISDLMAVFPKITLPYVVADTNLQKTTDTVIIGYKAFTQFFPDSSLTTIIGNNRKVVIHPVGLIEKEKENYLLVLFTVKKVSHLAVFVTDKKNKFLAAKHLLSSARTDDYVHSVSINKEPTFLVSQEKTVKDNQLMYTRAGWVYSSAGYFMVVVNDSNEDSRRKEVIINPLDSLARKNKFSGDYAQDKKNFISLRDGKTSATYLFFIHFEKEEGSCTGEIKGEMKMKDVNTAQFKQNGDPCIIDFNFEERKITLKEQGSCGNHRGIKCFFNDAFIKKRDAKPLKKK